MKKKNNKVKENPIMMDQKKIKKVSISSGDSEGNEIRTFVIIIVVIAILVGVIYGLTELFKKDETTKKDEIVSGSINYDKLSIGMLLNRPYNDYYVLIYDTENDDAVLYSTMLSKYMRNNSDENYIKIYFCDLNNSLNNKYYNVNGDNKSNPSAKTISELDLGDITLIRVQDGNISKYVEGYENIKEILK